MQAQWYFVVLNKGSSEHGPHRYRNVGSGAFVGVLHKGTSSLVQSTACDAGLEVFSGETDQGQDTF